MSWHPASFRRPRRAYGAPCALTAAPPPCRCPGIRPASDGPGGPTACPGRRQRLRRVSWHPPRSGAPPGFAAAGSRQPGPRGPPFPTAGELAEGVRTRHARSGPGPDGTQGPRRAPGGPQHLRRPAGALADRSGSPAYCVRIGHGHSCINWFPLIFLRFSLVLNSKIQLVYTSSIFNRSRPFISIYSG